MATSRICSIPDCGKFARSGIPTCAKHRPNKPPPKKTGRKPYKVIRACLVDGCERQARCLGYCLKHYKRHLKYNDPLGGSTEWGAAREYLNRLAVEPQDQDCISWPYTRNARGAAQIRIDGKCQLVTRILCLRLNGPPPSEKHQAAHSCGKGHEGCVNPRHLSWKTQKENELDKIVHGTWRTGDKMHWAKLTSEKAREIRFLAASGMRRADIARRYGITRSSVGSVVTRRTWKAA